MVTTTSGTIASFKSPGKVLIRSLKAYFEPVQEGSGDPSPSNVKQITGWTGINLYHYGKNLVNDKKFFHGNNGNSYIIDSLDNQYHSYLKAGSYRLKGEIKNGASYNFNQKRLSASAVVLTTTFQENKNMIFTLPADDHYRFNIYFANGVIAENIGDVMITVPIDDNDYEPFCGTIIPIDWSDNIGTIYGGYVNLITGEVVATWQSIKVKDLAWSYESAYNRFRANDVPNFNGKSTVRTTKFFFSAGSVYYNYEGGTLSNYPEGVMYSTGTSMFLHSQIYTTEEDLKSSLGEEQIIYPIVAPTTYKINSIMLKTLRGRNNIFSNANGNIEATYDFADSLDMLRIRQKVLKACQIYKKELPPWYKTVDYIVSTGQGAYIDTGVSGDNNDLSFECTFLITELSNYAGIFGNYTGSNQKPWRLIQGTSITWLYTNCHTSSGNVLYIPGNNFIGEILTVTMNNSGSTCIKDGSSLTSVVSSIDGTETGYNIAIGKHAAINPTATVIRTYQTRYYSFKIWDGTKLIRDYVPCLRLKDNIAGLWDKVTTRFYPSDSINNFSYGLPIEYTKYDFLKTKSHNAYIDTNVAGNDTTLVFDMDCMVTSEGSVNGSYYGLFGNAMNSKNGWIFRRDLNSADSNFTGFVATSGNCGLGNFVYPFGQGITLIDKKFNIRMSYGTCTATGTVASTVTPTTVEREMATDTILIGSTSHTSSGIANMISRIYYFKIWSQGNLIRDYCPCIRNSDNKAGFYDLVNNTFNPSIGSVDFVAGNDT